MPDIRHRIGADATPAALYRSLTTLDGLRSWWTTDTTGEPSVGGKITFRFGGPDRFFDMEVISSEPDSLVTWRVVDGPEEWIGTTVEFRLVPGDTPEETVVMFTHAGWREVVPFMHHCSTKWAIYLLSLRDAVTTGTGRPFPDDVKASSFD